MSAVTPEGTAEPSSVVIVSTPPNGLPSGGEGGMKSRPSDAPSVRFFPSATIRVGADVSSDTGILPGEVGVAPPQPLSRKKQVIARELRRMAPPR
jgi:hypothetical protein